VFRSRGGEVEVLDGVLVVAAEVVFGAIAVLVVSVVRSTGSAGLE
jgi:hypothetical protein